MTKYCGRTPTALGALSPPKYQGYASGNHPIPPDIVVVQNSTSLILTRLGICLSQYDFEPLLHVEQQRKQPGGPGDVATSFAVW